MNTGETLYNDTGFCSSIVHQGRDSIASIEAKISEKKEKSF